MCRTMKFIIFVNVLIEIMVFYLKHDTLGILHCLSVQIINLVWHEIFIRKFGCLLQEQRVHLKFRGK